MAEIIHNPMIDLFTSWQAFMDGIVGEGNAGFGAFESINEPPFAVLLPLPDSEYIPAADLEDNENAIVIGIQTESYGKTDEQAYSIDESQREYLKNKGFRAQSGRLHQRIGKAAVRVVSRYTMNYFGSFMG